jgi:hypothetical protein
MQSDFDSLTTRDGGSGRESVLAHGLFADTAFVLRATAGTATDRLATQPGHDPRHPGPIRVVTWQVVIDRIEVVRGRLRGFGNSPGDGGSGLESYDIGD